MGQKTSLRQQGQAAQAGQKAGWQTAQVTTKSVLVAGQWPLPLIDGAGGHFKYLDTASQWNEACFLYLIQGLPRGLSYVEYFGGVGIFSTIIQNSLAPTAHHIFDLD